MALMAVLLFVISAVMLTLDSRREQAVVPAPTTSPPTTTTTVPPQEVILDASVEMASGRAVVTASASVAPTGTIERLHCSMYCDNGNGRLVYGNSVSGSDAVWEIDSHPGELMIIVTALAEPLPDSPNTQSVAVQDFPVVFEPGEFVWPVEPMYPLLLHDRYQVSSGSETVGGHTHNNGLMREKHYVYGNRRNHYGLDITADPGSEVIAAADGKVLGIYEDSDSIGSTGYGTYMILRHDNKHNDMTVYTLYAHLSRPMASAGQKVSQGQAIALSGNTGGSRIPHLHLEFRLGANDKSACVDPLEMLPGRDFSFADKELEAENGFPTSSIRLHNAMLRFGWEYVITGLVKKDISASGITCPAGSEVVILSRSGNTVKCRYGEYEFSCKASSLEYTYDFPESACSD